MPSTIGVVGDALLDRDLDGRAERLAPDAPVAVVTGIEEHTRPGGAALAAVMLARDGFTVRLVTALGDDPAGRELRTLLDAADVEVVDLRRRGRTPEKVRVRAAGRAMLRLDHEDDDHTLEQAGRADGALSSVDAFLVSDYGRGVAAHPAVRRAVANRRSGPLVWDPHPLGPPPVPGASLATPSGAEARASGCRVATLADVSSAASELCARWGSAGVAVTLGERGAVLGIPGRPPYVSPAPRRVDGDPCGAGDRFAAAAVSALLDGALLPEATTLAVRRATRYVAEGGVQALTHPPRDRDGFPGSPIRPGVVVATSGCFDLLHAGHVASLEAARALGDHLVVLLNSDESVRRLKGPGRPVVGQRDRAAVLLGLACVDEVVTFEEDTPVRALQEIQPAIFAKGGDYGADPIPEEAAMRRWGGEVVIVPYLEGRSTSGLMEEVRGDR